MSAESLLLRLAAVAVLGVAAQWVAWRLRLPSILLLLLVGLAAGPGFEVLPVDLMLGELLAPLVSLGVAVILFEGGLSLDLRELRQIGRTLGQLILVGVLVTWALATTAAHYAAGLGWEVSLLLGAILTVTGPTVVGPLLRHVRPSGQVGPIANWEGIVADVIGATLAVLVFHALTEGGLGRATVGHTAFGLLTTLGAGALAGSAGAFLLYQVLRRHMIPDALQAPLVLAVVLGVYAVSDRWQHESGLLAVTLIGLALRNQHRVPVGHIVAFKENLRTLLLSSLFIILAARVDLADMRAVGIGEVVFVLLLVLVVRPIAVAAGTMGTGLPRRERIFLACLAPRGVVAAAVSALFGSQLDVPGAERLAPLTFLVIIVTVSVYGLASAPLARRLHLAEPNPQGTLIIGAGPFARAVAQALSKLGIKPVLLDSNRLSIGEARLAGLTAIHGSALDEASVQQLPLGGLGRVLAMTPNDEVNSLAILHYTELFGRRNSYQLAPRRGGQTEGASTDLRGRTLFAAEATFGRLARGLREGFEVRTTTLSEAFDLEAWRAHHGPHAVPLFRVDGEGCLHAFTDESAVEVAGGESLVGLVPPDREGKPESTG
jgi:NhaP-type Na+/H+ or K+/H+ antiporter